MGKSRKTWKKLQTVDSDVQKAVDESNSIGNMNDSDLFDLNDEPEPVIKLSKREERLQAHRDRLALINEDIKDVKKPIKPIAKREKIILKNKKVRGKEPTPPPRILKKIVPEDLWGKTEAERADDVGGFMKDGADYYAKNKKIIRAKKHRKTADYVPSGRQAVIVAKPGASYNPATKEYIEYAKEIATEELERLDEQKRVEKGLALPEGVSYVTQADLKAEMEQGFFDESSSDEEEMEQDDEMDEAPKKRSTKPKHFKKKKRALANKLAALEEQYKRQMTKKMNVQFNNIRKIIKQMDVSMTAVQLKAKERSAQKMIDQLLQKKKLGRGKFEKYEEPVLLPSEIKGSLRLAKTEGSILEEQFKSLQERNMLPQPGPDDMKRLPKRLKRRFVDKRGTDQVTAKSTVV